MDMRYEDIGADSFLSEIRGFEMGTTSYASTQEIPLITKRYLQIKE